MRSLKAAVVVAFVVAGAFAVHGGDQLQDYLQDLLSGDFRTSGAAVSHFQEDRAKLIQHLVASVDGELSDSYLGSRTSVIRLLREYRATEAVDVLAKGITFIPSGTWTDEDIPAEAYCVCAVALAEIGYPAIEKMVLMVCESEDPEERKLAAWVLRKVEGKKQAVHRLTARGERAGGRVQENCLEAIEYYDAKSVRRDPTAGKGRPGKWK